MSEKPELSIDFLVVGGGIAGLACAIALRRVGHNVVVLERSSDADILKMSHGGIRLPPNVSKILFHWGLERALRQVSITATAVEIAIYDTGEFVGTHQWEEEVLRETRGEYLFLHHVGLRRVLHDAAIAAGAEVRLGVSVVSVNSDDDGPHVTLTTGETLMADVIVGADGRSSIVQQAIVGKDVYGSSPYHCLFYNTTVPGALMRADPDLAPFFSQHVESMYLWMGSGRSALGFRVGGKDEFGLHFWVPPRQEGVCDDDRWGGGVDLDEMRRQLGPCEPRLLKMAKLAATPARVRVKMVSPMEDWVDKHGRLVIIGEAAHPLPAGSLQGGAMAVEDAAVLAKLFSHLRTEDQISTFLHAFQDLREDRCASVVQTEQGNLCFQMLPTGPHQEERDNEMRTKTAQGESVFGGGEAAEQWEHLKELFGYDAEDEADDWWVKWGLLRERAKQRSLDMEAEMKTHLSNIHIR
ncbi:FAD/NAD(P)-binding domain-containing protein [Rhizopogon vinicolor AM-OR11-026]|uniref:FAD/NAD(P)-binding domain-containing protein n=1 Tax=Rhizopogon vinicolor AM-OR11-026 TaxID=1314800 RepID=A0A1B7MPS2_9AGAM|nr:FAD/NAD(P)-binding domain-containing protein [Rhizopogon vinicolor AM-OR11-026]